MMTRYLGSRGHRERGAESSLSHIPFRLVRRIYFFLHVVSLLSPPPLSRPDISILRGFTPRVTD